MMEKGRFSQRGLAQRKLEVRPSRLDNFGVFSLENISRGDVIEECHVLVLSEKHEDLSKYYFDWPKQGEETVAIPLGYGSIYNHSDYPNATWENNIEKKIITFKARRDIQAGQEITVDYGNTWFEAREVFKKKSAGLQYEAHDDLLIGTLE